MQIWKNANSILNLFQKNSAGTAGTFSAVFVVRKKKLSGTSVEVYADAAEHYCHFTHNPSFREGVDLSYASHRKAFAFLQSRFCLSSRPLKLDLGWNKAGVVIPFSSLVLSQGDLPCCVTWRNGCAESATISNYSAYISSYTAIMTLHAL